MAKFSEILNKIMKEKNLTTKQLSSLTKISQGQIRNWLNGKSKPRINNIKKLCITLKIRADVILGIKEL